MTLWFSFYFLLCFQHQFPECWLPFSARHRKAATDSFKNISGQILQRLMVVKVLFLATIYSSLSKCAFPDMPVKVYIALIFYLLIQTFSCGCCFGQVCIFLFFRMCAEIVSCHYPRLTLNSSAQMIFFTSACGVANTTGTQFSNTNLNGTVLKLKS